ncbi:MAG: hypothetical protein ACAH59_04650 [Pseudobdellovibrionaceae bacterium]
MKTPNQRMKKGLLLSLLTASLVLSVGCAKKGDGFSADTSDPGPTATPIDNGMPDTPDTDTPRGGDFASGATAAFAVESSDAWTAYAPTHPLNNPQDMRVSVKLAETSTGSNQYYGKIYLSYFDNGQYYTARFETQNKKNPSGSVASAGTHYAKWNHASYNNFILSNGKPAFHGFFQDSLGAILFVVDEYIDQGDGAGATMLSGSIWFKNFANTQFSKTFQDIPCWFFSLGPYDCRTFLKSGGPGGGGKLVSDSALYPPDSKWYTTKKINPYVPVEPARGWRKLGTFNDLDKSKAFSH